MNLTPSASGCSRPKGPTRVGPQRFWMCAETFRSSQTLYATAVSRTKTTATDLTSEMITNAVMLNLFSCDAGALARVVLIFRPLDLCSLIFLDSGAFLVSRDFRVCGFIFVNRIQGFGIPSERPRAEQVIIGRNDQVSFLNRARSAFRNLEMLIVA